MFLLVIFRVYSIFVVDLVKFLHQSILVLLGELKLVLQDLLLIFILLQLLLQQVDFMFEFAVLVVQLLGFLLESLFQSLNFRVGGVIALQVANGFHALLLIFLQNVQPSPLKLGNLVNQFLNLILMFINQVILMVLIFNLENIYLML